MKSKIAKILLKVTSSVAFSMALISISTFCCESIWHQPEVPKEMMDMTKHE